VESEQQAYNLCRGNDVIVALLARERAGSALFGRTLQPFDFSLTRWANMTYSLALGVLQKRLCRRSLRSVMRLDLSTFSMYRAVAAACGQSNMSAA